MLRSRGWPLVLTAAACAPPGAAPIAASAPPLASSSATALTTVRPKDALAEAMCAGVDPAAPNGVRVHVEDAALGCSDGDVNRCEGQIRYAVANCGGEPIRLRAVTFTDERRRLEMVIEPSAERIDPRASWAGRTRVYLEASFSLELDVVDVEGAPLHLRARSVRVSNPTRRAILAACDACSGVWGVQGLNGVETCNCKARDAGRECPDGHACEGACEFDHWFISSPAQPLRCEGGRCSARPATGRPVGRCTERVIVRSCHTLLDDGIGSEPDRVLPWGLKTLCSD